MVGFYACVLVVELPFTMGSSLPFIDSGSATIDLGENTASNPLVADLNLVPRVLRLFGQRLVTRKLW